MFSRSRLLSIRRSTIQFQPSTRHFSLLKGPVSVERPQANSVKTRLPPIAEFHGRSTKSRNKFKRTSSDLNLLLFDSYRISLNQLKPLEFFGLQELPQPSVDQELLSNTDADAMQQYCHNELIQLVDLTMIPAPSIPVAQCTAKLFEVAGYLGEDRIAYNWMNLPLVMGNDIKHVKPDVCIVNLDQDEILLVAQEHKMTVLGGIYKARIQLVAAAVAAFNRNNLQREKEGLLPLAEKVMPGIVVAGTSPSFFKIPVTETLSSHIHRGTYPPCETQVTYCYTPVPACRRHEGMKPLDNRLEILKCYEAFKVFVGETYITKKAEFLE